jgi:hypothetical protein
MGNLLRFSKGEILLESSPCFIIGLDQVLLRLSRIVLFGVLKDLILRRFIKRFEKEKKKKIEIFSKKLNFFKIFKNIKKK